LTIAVFGNRDDIIEKINFKMDSMSVQFVKKLTTAKAMAWTMLTWKICRLKPVFIWRVRSKTHTAHIHKLAVL
jgi:hypothetical protein